MLIIIEAPDPQLEAMKTFFSAFPGPECAEVQAAETICPKMAKGFRV